MKSSGLAYSMVQCVSYLCIIHLFLIIVTSILAAKSAGRKDLMYGYVYMYNIKQVSTLQFRRHQLGSFSPKVR